MYQKKFWKGESARHNGREDKIKGNPEAPPMHDGPGEFDMDMGNGADSPKLGSSQPRVTGNKRNDELPLRHAHVKPKSHQMRQVLMAHALRNHVSTGGTTTAAIGGGAAGGGAGE